MNRKVLYGLTAGVIGYAAYRYMKAKINPLVLKNLESAFTTSNLLGLSDSLYDKGINTAKSLLEKNTAYPNHIEDEVLENIQELKEQILYMEEKISKFKNDI